MLTGKFYVKKRLFGGFNIMVEVESFDGNDPWDTRLYKHYRKAKFEDIPRLNIENTLFENEIQ